MSLIFVHVMIPTTSLPVAGDAAVVFFFLLFLLTWKVRSVGDF